MPRDLKVHFYTQSARPKDPMEVAQENRESRLAAVLKQSQRVVRLPMAARALLHVAYGRQRWTHSMTI